MSDTRERFAGGVIRRGCLVCIYSAASHPMPHARPAKTKQSMRNQILTSLHLLVSIAALFLIAAQSVSGQTFTTLHTFAAGSGYPSYTNSDGVHPADLIISGNTLYGSTGRGGRSGSGTIFKFNIDGSGFTNLHTFAALSAPNYTNDGAFAAVSLLVGSTLYGTAHEGGPLRTGTLFAINSDGTGFTNLYNFPYEGTSVYPFGFTSLGNTFYGAASGGSSHGGTLFKVTTNGTGFSLLYDFAPTYWNSTLQDYTNSDGFFPSGGLILSANTLYGTAYHGGNSDHGTVYKVNTDGTGFTTLHNFTAHDLIAGTNADGANPLAGLILSDNILYGTAMNGGSSGNGTLFKVNTDGTGFTTLHSFAPLGPSNNTNSDGANPYAGLVLSGNTLYGAVAYGGNWGFGTVFAVNTDGSGFVTLHHFRGSDGAVPTATLVLSGNTLYGTTTQGGSSGNGTVFSLSLPRLGISCPQPLILECTNGAAAATLDLTLAYSGSNPILVVWTLDGTPYQTNNLPPSDTITSSNVTFTANFGAGEHTVVISASNGRTAPVSCSTTVTVSDTLSPTVSAISATPDLLWPPNHRMVPVEVTVIAVDNCDPSAAARITSVTSNEPQNPVAPDWKITGPLSVNLRAERSGRAKRTYTVVVECEDASGNVSRVSVDVVVPHDQR